MSLLMEALRKAEEAKRRMQQEEQSPPPKDSREAAERVSRDSTSRSEASFMLEEREPAVTPEYIRDNFTTPQDQSPRAYAEHIVREEPVAEPAPLAPSPPEPSVRNVSKRHQRAAAASVFAAKQNPARNRTTLTILVLAMVLLLPLGGGILWYLQSAPVAGIGVNPAIANYDLSTRGLIGDAAQAPSETPATGAASLVAAGTTSVEPQNISAEEATAAPAAADDAAIAAAAESVPTIETNAADTVATTASEGLPLPVSAPDLAAAALPPVPVQAPAVVAQATSGIELPAAAATSVLEVSRTRAVTLVNPDLATAYASLQAGDLMAAGQMYQDVLNTLPNNRDALLGLALVYMRQGQPVASRDLYARLLQLNPRDPLAHTGLLQSMQVSDDAEHESALKKLMSQYPDVAQLTLALGNLYASQQRWSEAQAAYYNALLTASRSTGGPVHPDYAFNLAVSLEQLNEPKAALNYYRQAQELATGMTPGFDPQLLNSRLDYLLQQAQP